jgi:hypothetical protein
MNTNGIRNEANIPVFEALDSATTRLTIRELAQALDWTEAEVSIAISDEDGIVLFEQDGKIYVTDKR